MEAAGIEEVNLPVTENITPSHHQPCITLRRLPLVDAVHCTLNTHAQNLLHAALVHMAQGPINQSINQNLFRVA